MGPRTWDWIIALWLVACLAFAAAGTTVGVVRRDLALLASSSGACLGLGVVVGAPVRSWLSRRATASRRARGGGE